MNENFGHILVALNMSPEQSFLLHNYVFRRAKYTENSEDEGVFVFKMKHLKIFGLLGATVTLSPL